MAQDKFHTSHNYSITILEFPGIRFATLSGGESTVEGSKVWPGGSQVSRNVDGASSVSDIVVTKPADDIEDIPIKLWANGWRNLGIYQRLTVVKQRLLPSGLPVPGVSPIVYERCSYRNYAPPAAERGSSAGAMLSLTLSPESMQE